MIKSLEAREEVTRLSEEIADLSPTSPGISRRQSAKSQTRPWQDRYKFTRKSTTNRHRFLMCSFYTKCALLNELLCAAVNSHLCSENVNISKSVGTSSRQAAAAICPRPSSPSMGAEAPRAAEPTAPAESRPQRSSRFPRPIRSHAQRCSCLTR